MDPKLRSIRCRAGRSIRSGRVVRIQTIDNVFECKIIALRKGDLVISADGQTFRIVENEEIEALEVVTNEPSPPKKVHTFRRYNSRPSWGN